MSYRSLMNQPVTIVHPRSTAQGWVWDSSAVRAATFGRWQQAATVEETDGFPASSPDTTVTTGILFLGWWETVLSSDRAEIGGSVFEVVGDPDVVYDRRGGVHHFEVQLRKVVAV